jgi:hypothetical protein
MKYLQLTWLLLTGRLTIVPRRPAGCRADAPYEHRIRKPILSPAPVNPLTRLHTERLQTK